MKSARWNMCAVGLLAAAVAVAGCGKKKSSVSDGSLAEGAAITISGQLALENSSTAAALALDGLNATSDVALADLQVYCVSFSFPPKAGTGTVDGNGNFSLSIEANQVSIGCFILKGAETVATMVFEDTTEKSVDGTAKSDARLAFSGNTSMGTIKVDTATGKAKADVTAFKSAVKGFTGGGFDFTGTWKLKAADNLPTGYNTVLNCQPGTQGCEGPTNGMNIFLKRISGKKVADNTDAYAMAIWKSKAAFENCGQKLGFRNEDAKAKVGIDFSSSGLGDGALQWEPGWEQGWKSSAATAKFSRPNCEPSTLGGYNVMKCKGKAYNSNSTVAVAPVYSIGINSRDTGCKYDDGTVADIKGPVTWNTSSGTPCTDFGGIAGLKQCTNTGDYEGKNVTCKGIGGLFNEDGTAFNSMPSGGNFKPDQGIATNDSCNSGSSELAKLQCYADHYYQNRENGDKCIADVHLNWGAQNPNDFVMKSDGPQRSTNQFVMNLLTYTSDATAAVHDEKTYFRGVPVASKDGGNSFVNCKFAESTDMALSKLSETEILIELNMIKKSVDQNPACNSQKGFEAGGQSMKFLFKADKQ
ncbi:MAG: hypothetical protein ACO3A4_11700 [Silvanigrellaceae bacterium]